jgi:Fe-S cluster assembly iron-binding protein IscA
LGLVLDEPGNEDKVFNLDGLTYIVNKDLLEQVKPIRVDYIQTPGGGGFSISSNLKQGSGSGCC